MQRFIVVIAMFVMCVVRGDQYRRTDVFSDRLCTQLSQSSSLYGPDIWCTPLNCTEIGHQTVYKRVTCSSTDPDIPGPGATLKYFADDTCGVGSHTTRIWSPATCKRNDYRKSFAQRVQRHDHYGLHVDIQCDLHGRAGRG